MTRAWRRYVLGLVVLLCAALPSRATLTFHIPGVAGVESTFIGSATNYQSGDTLQALRLAGQLGVTGPQGAAWGTPSQAAFTDAGSSTNPGTSWPLKDGTTHVLDFTFNNPDAPEGYTLQNVSVFVHDHTDGRATYDFDVFYSTVADPATFIKVATARNWTSGNPGNPPGTQISLDFTNADLAGVKMVRFVFRPTYNGFGAYLDEIDLNATIGAPPPSTILDLEAAGVTDSSVTLSWTAPGGNGSTGVASSYDIRYAASPISDDTWDAAVPLEGEPIPQPAGTPQSMVVDGLAGDTTFYFAIRSTNATGGISFLSNVVSAQTIDVVAPAPVSDLAAGNPTENSLTLTWTAPGDNGTSGTATSYDIRYAADIITDANWDQATPVAGAPAPAPAGSQQSFTVTGLSPDTMYFFAMKTSDEAGNLSALSNIASQRTTIPDVIAPSPVTDLAAGEPTMSTLRLTWTAPGDDGNTGAATSYDLRYSTSEISEANWDSAVQLSGEPVPAVAGTSQSMIVGGLRAGTTYYFAMKTADEMGNTSALSNLASGTTAPPPPQAYKRVLSEADFRYQGYYRLPYTVIGDYPLGFTHRYVNGQLRFLTGSFTLREFAAPPSLGSTVTSLTGTWSDIWTGTGLAPAGAWVGLWFDQAHNRLWTTWALDYPDTVQALYTKSLAVRTLNSDGTISNVAGPWGLEGVQQRRLYGGVTALPQWFQDFYDVGPYACGWGGYASRLTAGAAVSLGPTFYTIPEPTAYASGDIPSTAFKTLMDHSAASTAADWYVVGHPTSCDRGVRNADVQNDYESNWQSPAPDGLGRWVWGDSAWNTGAWIDTPTRHGFIIVPKFCSGRVWYYGSTLNCERQTAEIQVFDPKTLGEVARGERAAWNTYPASRWEITEDILPLGLGWGTTGNGNTGGPCGATYDDTTRTLYVYCAGRYHQDSYILVYQVGPIDGDVDGDGHVDVSDLLWLVDAWGRLAGDAHYDSACDFNGDGSVDVVDLLMLVDAFGT